MLLILRCVCGGEEFSFSQIQGISVNVCKVCGIVHQLVDMTETELEEFYRNSYSSAHQTQIGTVPYIARYNHDKDIAKLRHDKYKLNGRILDVGCGNGAFVDEGRRRGIAAFGTAISADFDGANPKWTYSGKLNTISFPSGYFDAVCYHDVLEHVVDLRKELLEVRRILKDDGQLIIDFPNFWVDEGVHHWRLIQHLWMLNLDQLVTLLKDVGFKIKKIEHPISGVPSKFLVIAENQPIPGPSLLVLPGMGDIYWTAVKLSHWGTIYKPRVYVWNFDGRKRSADYVERIPFFRFVDYLNQPHNIPEFQEVYLKDARTWIPNVLGMDYLIAYNGVLRMGRSLEEVDPHLECNWNFPFFTPIEELVFTKLYREMFGKYFVVYFSDHGMFRDWLKAWGIEGLTKIINRISKRLDAKPILTGSRWDESFNLGFCHNSDWINLTGKTNMAQLFGLLKGSLGCFGFPGGNTIQSAHFGVPTVIVWNRYFRAEAFYTNGVRNIPTYKAVKQKEVSPQEAADVFIELVRS